MLTNKDAAQILSGETSVESQTTEENTPGEAGVETPVETTPTPTKEPVQESETQEEEEPGEQEETPQAPAVETPPLETKSEQQPQSPRPSRAERRIQRLHQEKRSLEEQIAAFGSQPVPQLKPNEHGEINLPDLDNYIGERASQIVQRTLAEERAAQEYRDTVLDWADDLSETISDNPELDPKSPQYNEALDQMMKDMLEKANFDEAGNPHPKVYASEIFGQIKAAMTKTQTKAKQEGQAEAAANLQRRTDEGAITPGAMPSKTSKYTDAELADIQLKDPRKYTDMVKKGLI